MKLLFVFVALAVFLSADAIGRQEVLKRAAFWVSKKVKYSMSAQSAGPDGKSYRTDCSGFVSMAWQTGTSHTTMSLPGITKSIPKDQLKAGDIMCKCGGGTGGANGHVLIFEKWADAGKTSYWTYEQHGPTGTPTAHRTVKYPYNSGGTAYKPYRYNKISD